jgi:hypothetical protein
MLRLIAAIFLLLASFGASAQALPKLDLQFERLERQLRLTPEQKEQYEMAVGATKRLMLGLTLAALQAKERLATELAKPRPDFGSLEGLQEEILGQSRTLRREARDEWVKLYGMLDEQQVAELRDFLQRRIDHLGLLHDFLRSLPPR